MLVARAVVHHGLGQRPLYAVLGHSASLREIDRNLQQVERRSGIAVGKASQVVEQVVIQKGRPRLALGSDGAVHDGQNVGFRQLGQREGAAPRQQRIDEAEARVLSSSRQSA